MTPACDRPSVTVDLCYEQKTEVKDSRGHGGATNHVNKSRLTKEIRGLLLFLEPFLCPNLVKGFCHLVKIQTEMHLSMFGLVIYLI